MKCISSITNITQLSTRRLGSTLPSIIDIYTKGKRQTINSLLSDHVQFLSQNKFSPGQFLPFQNTFKIIIIIIKIKSLFKILKSLSEILDFKIAHKVCGFSQEYHGD